MHHQLQLFSPHLMDLRALFLAFTMLINFLSGFPGHTDALSTTFIRDCNDSADNLSGNWDSGVFLRQETLLPWTKTFHAILELMIMLWEIFIGSDDVPDWLDTLHSRISSLESFDMLFHPDGSMLSQSSLMLAAVAVRAQIPLDLAIFLQASSVLAFFFHSS